MLKYHKYFGNGKSAGYSYGVVSYEASHATATIPDLLCSPSEF
jgi:hypothetical protein